MDKVPKTRQEKKGRGKFYGRNDPVFSQKHVRLMEQTLLADQRKAQRTPVAVPSPQAKAVLAPTAAKKGGGSKKGGGHR
jgi:hypothetical protein